MKIFKQKIGKENNSNSQWQSVEKHRPLPMLWTAKYLHSNGLGCVVSRQNDKRKKSENHLAMHFSRSYFCHLSLPRVDFSFASEKCAHFLLVVREHQKEKRLRAKWNFQLYEMKRKKRLSASRRSRIALQVISLFVLFFSRRSFQIVTEVEAVNLDDVYFCSVSFLTSIFALFRCLSSSSPERTWSFASRQTDTP